MRLLSLCFVLVGVFVTPIMAQKAAMPSPDYEALEVVEIQLNALRDNNLSGADTGIAQVWAFAHPDNKRMTGPLDRFARMIKSTAYRTLIGHKRHHIKAISRSDDEALFAVIVTGADGKVVGYRWAVRKVTSGEFLGAWMTTSVSPPIALGEET